jgi:hypothetical protein
VAPPVTTRLGDDTVLLGTSAVAITKGEYDAELLRLPADVRAGFSTSPERVAAAVNNLWTMKTLATAARAEGIDKDRDVQRRIDSEINRLLASALVERIETEAGRAFDARGGNDAVARERYLVNSAKYRAPEQVTVTHLLFGMPKHSSDDARALAVAARAKILAGADMSVLAREISEDPSAPRNNGKLDWFTREQMDPSFAAAAFGLKNANDVSEPVLSRFGWHLIRLDGRRAEGSVRPYDEVKAEIIAELRRAYVDERRTARVSELRNQAKIEINKEAMDALVVRPPSEALGSAVPTSKP